MNSHEIIKNELIVALCEDLPLLQYGSGDFPSFTSGLEPTTQVIAQLTVQYIERLVRAAVDAQDMLLDGGGGILPAQPIKCDPIQAAVVVDDAAENTHNTRKRKDMMNWEDELPKPLIRSNPSQEQRKRQAIMDPAQPRIPTQTSVQGLDFFSKTISEDAFCYPGSNFIPINVQCFLFPVYHDAALYSRVKELLAARSSMVPKVSGMERNSMKILGTEQSDPDPMLLDPVIWSMVQQESPELLEQILFSRVKSDFGGKQEHERVGNLPGKRQRMQLVAQSGLSAAWPLLDRHDEHFLVPVYKKYNS
jgi:hypothetical protein